MSTFDPDRIVAETFVQRVEYRDVTDSTNDLALERLAEAERQLPLLVIADRQTHGRGRGENRWWADAGALTFTLAIGGRTADLSAGTWPQVSLATALAVCESLLDLLPDYDIRLKWPNDVFVQSRKACGILVETSPARPGVLVIGVGINVNNSMDQAPESLRQIGTSLIDVTGHRFDRPDLLMRFLKNLESCLHQLETETMELSDRWRRLCMLQGRTLCVESGTLRCVGVCEGIDDQGALLLQTEGGVQRCFAGVVTKIF